MLTRKPVFRRNRIREVVPEVIPADQVNGWRDPEADTRATDIALAEEDARAEAARAEAARAEAAREEAAREEAARAEAAREEAAREEAARKEAARAEEASLQAALLEAARNEAARAEALTEPAEVESRKPEPAQTSAARAEAMQVEAAATVAPAQVAEAPATSAPEREVETAAAEAEPEISDGSHAPQQLPEVSEWTCQIRLWRGYRRAAFYAGTYHAGEEVAVAESPFFRLRGNGLPEPTEQAEAAYNALCEQLEQAGWRLAEAGETWFDHVFRREVTAAAEPAPE